MNHWNKFVSLHTVRWIQLILLALTIACVASSCEAATKQTRQCQQIHWRPGQVYTLHGSINHATHVIFDSDKAMDPIAGNSVLWQVEARGHHVFLKPTDATHDDGAESTLTYLGQNGHNYEFILKRDQNLPVTCIHIVDPDPVPQQTGAHGDSNRATAYTTDSPASLTPEALHRLRRSIILEYQNRLHTHYRWHNKKHWLVPDLIESVFDDGRWTYIRFTHDNGSLVSVLGCLGHETVLLQTQYDSFYHIMTIAGVYPTLQLRKNKQTLTIKRLS